MTRDEIYEQLDLQEPEDFKLQAHWNMCDLHFQGYIPLGEVFQRRYGKTTRTIVAALEHLSENPDEQVVLVHANRHQADYMLKRAQEWAYQLGLPSHRIKSYVARDHEMRGVIGYYDRQVYRDPDATWCQL